MILFYKKISESNYLCKLDLDELYQDVVLLEKFNSKWKEFLDSDIHNRNIFKRTDNIIEYPHKSWVPTKDDGRFSILILGGNPAPHSVVKDIYYSYEGKGIEHRFWKVLRELGFIDLQGKDPDIKEKFLNLNYSSDFRFGMEAIFSFPSSASHKKWSGVAGVERLFGKKYLNKIYEIEKERVKNQIRKFFKNKGLIIAMQKDAYNSISDNKYNVKLAVSGDLRSSFEGSILFGTPPTRWLHTRKMKDVLSGIKSYGMSMYNST